ncbi:MAG: hypothetical protein WCB44_00215, partial [Stellaceae bacterium]
VGVWDWESIVDLGPAEPPIGRTLKALRRSPAGKRQVCHNAARPSAVALKRDRVRAACPPLFFPFITAVERHEATPPPEGLAEAGEGRQTLEREV